MSPEPPPIRVELPEWLRPVADLADPADATSPADGSGRAAPATALDRASSSGASAVLLLFGESETGPDILLIERAHTLRSHPGQPAFPGGRIDPDDSGPVGAALREAVEETGLDPHGVQPFGTLRSLRVPPGDDLVTPVLGWWHRASPVGVVDPAEVASVHRVPIATLLDPAHRFRVRKNGYIGPAFGVAGLVVWGFTGGVLDRLFRRVGWERVWNTGRVYELSTLGAGSRSR